MRRHGSGGSEDGEGPALTRAGLLAWGGAVGLSLAGLPDRVESAFAAPVAAAPASGARHFVSRRDLRPPVLTVRHAARDLTDDLFFIAPSSGPGQRGVLVFDASGEPVWFHPTTPVTAMNFRASLLHGKPVLSWWEGKAQEGLGHGVYTIVDQSYRQLARIPAGGHRDGDLHEFLITPRGTALITKNDKVVRDIRAYGGSSRGTVIDGVVQEIAIPSGRVLFEWRSLDHVGLDESHVTPSKTHFDYFHVNSVDVDADGHLIVSARNTWGIYKVHRHTGEVLWRLGGRKSDFAMGRGTQTAWQHDARSHEGGRLISIFDDGAAPQVATQSRAVLVRLDMERMTATLVRKYVHRPGRIVSRFMGNAQVLPDGNVVVGWGSEPFVTEFGRQGDIRFEARLPKGGMNYRAFRFPWTGTPSVPPALAAGVSGGRRGLFASWNGATEVASWQLLYGPSAANVQEGAVVPRTGFETWVGTAGGAAFAQVVALDGNGRELARSRPRGV
jgi:hypothetical protein